MVPLARALQNAGHTVSFATAAPLHDTIRRDGFESDAAGLSHAEFIAARESDPRFAPARADPRQARPLNFALAFAGFEIPPRLADLESVIENRRPDLIVHETTEFAGPLAAALRGLPAVTHSFGPLVEPEVMTAAGRSAAEHWVRAGLAPPDRGGMYDGLYLDITPPSVQFAEITTVPSRQLLRPEPYLGQVAETSGWDIGLSNDPVVAVTLGTVHGKDTALFRTILDGLADQDLVVAAATGSSDITRALEPHPANARVHDWLPWATVLERATVAVSHGGAGTTLACLYRGVPMVLVPVAADHFTNCRALAPTGAAVVLERQRLTPAAVRQAVESASSAPARLAAARLAAEIQAMPSPEDVASVLAELA